MKKITLVIGLILAISVTLIQAQKMQPISLNHAELGFTNAACGPMVRSSYHADQQVAL